jgi:hypothetical protein
MADQLIPQLVNQFNVLLNELFDTLTFCQHDSDYRIVNKKETNDKINKIVSEFNDIAEKCPDFVDHVYMHSKDWYLLTRYQYDYHYPTTTYAAHKFLCVEKKLFNEYCVNNNLSPNEHLVDRQKQKQIRDSFSMSYHKKTFKSKFEKDIHGPGKSVIYKLPDYIDITCHDIIDQYGYPETKHFKLLEEFTFIDGLKFKDGLPF